MLSVITMLKETFGPSWQTKTLGVLLILLALPCAGVGVLFTLSPSTLQAGIAITSQAGVMIVTGIGFLLARSNTASEVAHQESLDEIAAAKLKAEREHAQNARNIEAVHEVVQEVKAVVKPGP